jgi:hypothetical protein
MVLPTPELIKEAVAGSHIAVWHQPSFSRIGMFIFTLIFGVFGMHYVMLRAPLIAVLFILINAATSGYWLMFDLLQLMFTSVDDLNTFGLGSPFLFEYGVAVGMWQGGTVEKEAQKNASPGSPASPQENSSPNLPDKPLKGGGFSVLGSKGAAPAPAPAPAADSPPKEQNLKDTAAKFAESLLKLVLDWILSKRKDPGPKSLEWGKPISNLFTYGFWVFFYILSTPLGPISSAIAGDNWSAIMHLFNPMFILTSIVETLYITFFPMEVFVNGVTRPFPYVWLFTSIAADGQSEFIQRSKIAPSDPADAYKMIEPYIDIARQGIGLAEGLLTYVPLAAGAAGAKALDKFSQAAMIGAQAQAQAQAKPSTPQKGGFIQKGGFVEKNLGSPDTISIGILAAVVVGGLLLGLSRNAVQGNNDSPPVPGRV